MSRKKTKRRHPLLLLLLVLAAAVLFLRFGGGGNERYRLGVENPKIASGERSHPLESPLPQSLSKEKRNSASELWKKLFPRDTVRETPSPAEPVPLEALAAWCMQQRGQGNLQEETAAEKSEAGQTAVLAPEGKLPAAENEETAGFPGILVFQYLPPSEKNGFCALLLSFGAEPISITGRTSQEFCEKVISRLDALAGSKNQYYTRFYALDTACAGPSQSEWLYENVKKRFPHILYTGQPSLNHDPNDTP